MPEPETPVTTVSRLWGISKSMFLRLWTRAPRTRIPSLLQSDGRGSEAAVSDVASVFPLTVIVAAMVLAWFAYCLSTTERGAERQQTTKFILSRFIAQVNIGADAGTGTGWGEVDGESAGRGELGS